MYRNLFPDEAVELSAELKDLTFNLRDAEKKLERKRKGGGKKRKLKKLEKKVEKLKKERKRLKRKLKEFEYATRHISTQPWWTDIVEKTAPKIIDLVSVIVQTQHRKREGSLRQNHTLPPPKSIDRYR